MKQLARRYSIRPYSSTIVTAVRADQYIWQARLDSAYTGGRLLASRSSFNGLGEERKESAGVDERDSARLISESSTSVVAIYPLEEEYAQDA